MRLQLYPEVIASLWRRMIGKESWVVKAHGGSYLDLHLSAMGGSRRRSTVATRAVGVLMAALVLVVTGCSDGGDTADPPRSSVNPQERARVAGAALDAVAGKWTGEWRQTSGGQEAGTLAIEWQQAGRVLRGLVSLPGMSCVDSSDITAVLNQAEVTFLAVKSPEARVTFAGTIAGDTIDGTYEATCGEATGVWQARRA